MSLYITEEKKMDFNHHEKNSDQIPFQLCILCSNTPSDKAAGKITSGVIVVTLIVKHPSNR